LSAGRLHQAAGILGCGRQVFNALSQGGQVHMPLQQTSWSAKFGMLQDQFGISWMVNCAQAAQAA